MPHITMTLVIFVTLTANEETPSLFREKSFSSSTLAHAVNHYIKMGEQDAIKELKALASASRSDADREWRTRERIGWVCRIVYQPKHHEPLRAPMYGALDLPCNTMPLQKWPLYPIALSGSTYFVLSEGYTLAGVAEEPEEYIEYCRTNGRFRKDGITIPTRDQAVKDAARLRDCAAWNAIKWKDAGQGFSYSFSEDWVWESIEAQAKASPAR